MKFCVCRKLAGAKNFECNFLNFGFDLNENCVVNTNAPEMVVGIIWIVLGFVEEDEFHWEWLPRPNNHSHRAQTSALWKACEWRLWPGPVRQQILPTVRKRCTADRQPENIETLKRMAGLEQAVN